MSGIQKKIKKTYTSPIAHPLAEKKLAKKLLKTSKKASSEKGGLHRGVKEVMKAIKKKETGLCLIAGDISPIDVITHLPVLCEEANITYVFVPSKEDLGAAAGCKRPTSCVMIKSQSKVGDKLKELTDEVKKVPIPKWIA
eukprot:TRINITY_DN718_c0_g1_i1.p2 TRINITY_DN718_c0_g1~~TRINITY_DN718_c0_g1_i1.p2  ORF type:complete len:140 (-),score=42.38 TRINITY_DN718_c0_g1_i1:53-472(-)